MTQVIISFLRHVFADRFSSAVAITAPTGIAATHIGGTTLHSASSVGVPTFHADFERRMGGGGSHSKGKQLATGLEVLLIDEAAAAPLLSPLRSAGASLPSAAGSAFTGALPTGVDALCRVPRPARRAAAPPRRQVRPPEGGAARRWRAGLSGPLFSPKGTAGAPSTNGAARARPRCLPSPRLPLCAPPSLRTSLS